MNTNTINPPSFTFYHANAKCTGCALKLTLYPATVDETGNSIDGHILAEFANQKTVGDRRGPNPTYPTFDWDNRIVVQLGFNDLSQMLQTLRGETESVGEGRGLYHLKPDAVSVIKFSHQLDPYAHYLFSVERRENNGETQIASICITSAEACGLAIAIEGVMHRVMFGD